MGNTKISEDANLYLVAIEECSEVQKELSKLLRFGRSDYCPEIGKNMTNDVNAVTEFYELCAMIEYLQNNDLLPKFSDGEIEAIKQKKISKVLHYAEYSKQKGTIL